MNEDRRNVHGNMVQFFGFAIFGRKVIVDEKSQLPVLNVDEGRSTLQILQVDVLEDPSVDDHVILHLDRSFRPCH
jgi:hypothetical protein